MSDKEKYYLKQIKKNAEMYDEALTEEEEHIIKEFLKNHWVQYIYEVGISVGYDSFNNEREV